MTLASRSDPPAGRLSILTAICGALLVSCGVQGPIRPPRIQQPQRVTDLSVAQVGHALQLSFTLPRLATDGERLTKPLEVQLLRATFPAGPSAPPPAGSWSFWLSLAPRDVEKQTHGEKLALPVELSEEEFRTLQPLTLLFGVRTLTRRFRQPPVVSDVSNVVQTTLLEAPEAVQGLQARTVENAIELSWTAPAKRVSAYRVYRSQTGKPESFVLRGEAATTAYSDSEFAFGRTYFYKVTAIVKQGAGIAAGEDSATIAITPQDTFPPAAPRGVTALYTTDAVELIWNANAEADLGGYNVYRGEEGTPESKINPEPLPTPVFRDTSVAPKKNYIYRVTALDLANNESPPSEEVVALTR